MSRSRRNLAIVLSVPLALSVAGAALGAASPTFTDSRANTPQVAGGQVDADVPFPTNKQNEPTIARNPVTGKFIAGSNDEQKQPACGPGEQRGSTAPANDCSFFDGVGTSGVYTSDDGTSWTNRGMLPGFTDTTPGARFVSDGDPVVVYGPTYDTASKKFSTTAYTAYFASLASYATGKQPGNQVPELLTVSTSTDDGGSWSDPVVAADGRGTIFNDKEALWADRNPASPYFGRLYMSWTQFRGQGGAEPIKFASSKDGGQTWSLPASLSPAYNNGTLNGRQGSAIRTGPGGEVYVAWEDTDNKLGSVQVLSVSRDGGRTFSKPVVAGRVNDIADPIGGSNFRTNSFPVLAVSQTTGGHEVHVIYTSIVDARGQVVVRSAPSRTLAFAETPLPAQQGYAFYPAADIAPNGRLDVGWQAQTQTSPTTYGTGNARVTSWFASRPAGGGFTAPSRIDKAGEGGSDPAASSTNSLTQQFWGDYNTLVSDATSAYFIYTDSRTGDGCAAVDAYQQAVGAGSTTAVKPAPQSDCDGGNFGDTDIWVSKVTP